MRVKSVTERYRAVNEGSMTKKEFVRQMRQQYPMHITQFNGFDDSVQILKNRGLLFETKKEEKAKVYDERPALNYSLDALDRGIRAELGTNTKPSVEEFKAAEKKAKDNLEKNPTHYLDLMSGESNKVDKHDREVETKRGKEEVDVFNGLKKATLKETSRPGYKEDGTPKSNDEMEDDEREDFYNDGAHLDEAPSLKESIASAIDLIRKQYNIPGINSIIKDFIKTHLDDLKAGADPLEEFENFVSVNYDRLDEEEEVEINTDADFEREQRNQLAGRNEETDVKEGQYFGPDGDSIIEIIKDRALNSDFSEIDEAMEVMEFIGQHYGIDFEFGAGPSRQQEAKGKDHDGDGDIDGDDYMAAKDKAIKKAMGKEDVDEMYGDGAEALNALMGVAGIGAGSYALVKLMDALEGGKFGERGKTVAKHLRSMGSAAADNVQNRLEESPKENELKEAVKSIIRKVLTEESLNEAATGNLSAKADEYEGFQGLPNAINQLENIVTDIESYYTKVREKIQKVYDDLGNVTNEEGLKVGGFIAPAIEAAFMKDLKPVVAKGFTKGLETPKVRTISQADIDAHNSGARPLGEEEIEEKQTMFTPVYESKEK